MRWSAPPAVPTLLFDGECRLCRAVGGWLQRHAGPEALRIVALQDAEALPLLRAAGLAEADFESAVWIPAGGGDGSGGGRAGALLRSDAMLAALGATRAPWRWARVLRWVPRRWRDAGYRWVARHRHRYRW